MALCSLNGFNASSCLKLQQSGLPHHNGLSPRTESRNQLPSLSCFCGVFYHSSGKASVTKGLAPDVLSVQMLRRLVDAKGELSPCQLLVPPAPHP